LKTETIDEKKKGKKSGSQKILYLFKEKNKKQDEEKT